VEVVREGEDRFRVRVGEREHLVVAQRLGEGLLRLLMEDREHRLAVTVQGARRFIHDAGSDWLLERMEGASRRSAGAEHGLEAPMPGMVVKVHVKPGEMVQKGAPLLTLEAMKMEHVIRSPQAGKVVRLACSAGQMVEPGMALVEVGGP
jgi:3-methylcrotonyl-CoA carboxylase alpha subunit